MSSNSLLDVLKGTAMKKEAFEPPMPAQPPMDPMAAGGAMPPMDPAAAGGAPPPMPPPQAAPPAAPPAEAGAMPPAGPPPMDPQMMQQMQMALMDPNVQALLAQIGIVIDPQQGPIDQATGQVIPPEEMLMILQELMAQMPPPGAVPGGAPVPPGGSPAGAPPAGGAMPPKMAMEKEAQPMPMAAPPAGAPIAPVAPVEDPMPPEAPPAPFPAVPIEEPQTTGGNIEERLTALEDLVGEIAAKLEVNPETKQSVIEEGLTEDAQEAINPEEDMEAEKIAEEECDKKEDSECEETMKNPEKKETSVEEPKENKKDESEEGKPSGLIGENSEKTADEKQEDRKEAKEKEKPLDKKASAGRKENAAQKLTRLIGKLKNSYNN